MPFGGRPLPGGGVGQALSTLELDSSAAGNLSLKLLSNTTVDAREGVSSNRQRTGIGLADLNAT